MSQREGLLAKLERWSEEGSDLASSSSWKEEWAEYVKEKNEAQAANDEWKKTRQIKTAKKIPMSDPLYATLKQWV